MGLKLLLDENVSPAAVRVLWEDGFDVCHVRDRGLNAASDPKVFEAAFKEDRVVVTINDSDFRKLCRRSELHAGVIFLKSGLLRDEQIEQVRRAARRAAEFDMANRILLAHGEEPWQVLEISAEPTGS